MKGTAMRRSSQDIVYHFQQRLESLKKECLHIIVPQDDDNGIKPFLASLRKPEAYRLGTLFLDHYLDPSSERQRGYREDCFEGYVQNVPEYKTWRAALDKKTAASKAAAEVYLKKVENTFNNFLDRIMVPDADYLGIVAEAIKYKESNGWKP